MESPLPTVMMIMLCHRATLGGAEKRYARVFQMLRASSGAAHRLVITRRLLELLQSAGILVGPDASVIVLDPPSSRSAAFARRRRFGLAIDTIWYAWQCWRHIRACKPAVVHPLLTAIYFCLPSLAFGGRTRFVLSAYSWQFRTYRDRVLFGIAVGAALKRWLMQRCAVIDALSGSIADDLVARGIGREKILVAPCSFTETSALAPASVRDKVVVFLGRFVAIKDPLLLARAVPAILRTHPDTTFCFLGEGPLEDELRSELATLAVPARVEIRFEPKPAPVLERSSIFVSLQEGENYPSQSLLEAMACGNAVVATDVGETWRLVDEENGKRVVADAGAVADAIIALLDDPCLAHRQTAARRRVLAEHTPERFLAYIGGVYRRAAAA